MKSWGFKNLKKLCGFFFVKYKNHYL